LPHAALRDGGAAVGEDRLEELAGKGVGVLGQLFGGADADDLAAGVAFRAKPMSYSAVSTR